jgi:hypothetical protein
LITAWWTLDEPSGDFVADSVGGHHGTAEGGTSVEDPGHVDAGRLFDGSGLVVVPSSPSLDPLAGDFSIDAWVRPVSDGYLPIVTKVYAPADAPLGYGLVLDGLKASFYASNDEGTITASVPEPLPSDGEWHFVAVTVSRGSETGGRLYVDGVLEHIFDTVPLSGTLQTDAELHIAEQPAFGRGLSRWFFVGALDEIEIFQRVLAPEEIQSLYMAGESGKCGKPDRPGPTPVPTPPVGAQHL